MTFQQTFRLVTSIVVAALFLAAQTQVRDPANYLTHEPIHLGSSDTARAKKEAETRGFLWDNWSHRRRAHLIETGFSTEGEQSVTEFFVEPDSIGTWLIQVEIDREVFSRDVRSPSRTREKIAYTCTALERVEPPPDLLHSLITIPEGVDRRPTTYRLRPRCGPECNLPTLW